MSDIRFDGHAPKSALGKKFWFESDWWYAFMEVIDDLMQDKFPIDENFYEDCDFCPRTPHFDETTSQQFAAELSALVTRGSAKTFLENYFREDPLYVEYFGNDEEEITDNIQERMEEMLAFSRFLKDCGGCEAAW